MDLSKNYDPSLVEDKWSSHWRQKGYFKSEPDERKPFTVVIPPPNVTGVLHMGHTLNETVQDILVRRARMSGWNACWVPGSDHASIATEARVVQMLKEKGINKNDLSRKAYLEYAYEWKNKFAGIIYGQIEKLGCSVDWDRVNFTMDDHYYRAVIKVFVALYQKGLIYRGARMVNWDTAAKTALSDEEVEYREVEGTLYYIKYKIIDNDSLDPYLIIATQRPETIMGDTAVCVNPSDGRYAHLKGNKVRIPLVDREVQVIFDEYVDPAFGTGVLKITPAHDVNDYNLSLKYNLPVIDTLNEDGTLSKAAGAYAGLDRFEARKKVVEQLKSEGLLVKEEDYKTRIGYSQRTQVAVEPRISTQWFVNMKELAKPAIDAVLEGQIRIYPEERFLNTYRYWLENVKDWCISRQLWWGQQIPAWYDAKGVVYVAESEEDAIKSWQAANENNGAAQARPSPFISRDEDVLDTWFSSWLWPMEVFEGISRPGNPDFNYYYPTSVLVTGQDIIFFWVARMIMAGFAFEKLKPFSDVYFTGMVRDKLGRKMSKSLGNSPDLLELIDKYGADAVRFGILISSPAGNDLLFDEASLEQGRNFNNKLWNALKLLQSWEQKVDQLSSGTEDFATAWFESRLQETRSELDQLFRHYRLSEALKKTYSLIWDDFCSWYLEWAKPAFEQPIGKYVYDRTVYFFEELLHMLHPFMPFITEEIYHLLKKQPDDLCIRQYPVIGQGDRHICDQGKLLQQAITGIRDAKTKNQLKQKEAVNIYIQTDQSQTYKRFEPILARQANAKMIQYDREPAGPSITIVAGRDKFFLETEKEVDTSHQINELKKEIKYLEGFLVNVNKKLSNERFVQNANPDVIAHEQKKKADAEAKMKVLEDSLANL